MVRRILWQVLCSILVALAIFAMASSVRAEEPRRAGAVRLEAPGGRAGPLELRADGDGYAAELVIVNEGKEPLVVSRIAPRGDAADPRVPPKLFARVPTEPLPITIAPGDARTAVVRWTPSPAHRHRQLFGHVIVTTSDERAEEVAIGVRAQVPGPLGRGEAHVLALLIAAPLAGALTTSRLRGSTRRRARVAHLAAMAAIGAQSLLAAYVYGRFVPELSRADGNDGLQFVEHVTWGRGWLGEIYLGVDGVGVLAILVTSLVVLLAIVWERPEASAGSFLPAVLVLDASVVGAAVAMDGASFLLFAAAAVVASALLVGTSAEGACRPAAKRLLASGGVAIALLAVAIFAAARAADPTFSLDGTNAATTLSLPELSRVAFGAKGASLFGLPLEKAGFVLVVAASLCLLASFPAHRWLSDVLAASSAPTGALVATALPTVGVCAFLRVGCTLFPDGMRWGSGVVVALGAVTAAYGALLALGEEDLRRMAACTTTSHAGFVLLGAGSLTPQGLSGAIVLGTTRPLACALLLFVVSVVHTHACTMDGSRLGGFAAATPRWTATFIIASLAQTGVLGLGGAWGPALAFLGALAGYAPLALVAALALVVLTAAHLRWSSRVVFTPLDVERTGGADLERAAASRPPIVYLTRREWFGVAPLALLVLALGVWPAPVIATSTGAVRDLVSRVGASGPARVATR